MFFIMDINDGLNTIPFCFILIITTDQSESTCVCVLLTLPNYMVVLHFHGMLHEMASN